MRCSVSCYNAQKQCIITFLVLVLNPCLCVEGQSNIGDDCDVRGAPGTCLLIDSCPDALKNISSERPIHCGFSGSNPIVCCPKTLENKILESETLEPNKEVEVGKKAKEKCLEYSSYIYEWELPDNETDTEKKIRVNRCGHITTALTVGYDVTAPGEFPHMALVGKKLPNNTRHWTCGGTLISEEFVMTAAQCTNPKGGIARWVRLGEFSLDVDGESKIQDFGIDEIIRHPDYKPPIQYNDIALLRLDRRATLNKFVIPACLHMKFDVEQKTAMATGWGQSIRDDFERRLDLAKVELEIYSLDECNSTLRFIHNDNLKQGIAESMICAGDRELERGTCKGDGGGPLQVYLKTPYCMYDVIGITSFGWGCGFPGVPEVYTRVSHYVRWIESIVWPN